MKIGILTYHWVFNHGANLQTLSTIGYMRKIGHEPVVINWIPRDLEQAYLNYTIQDQVECFRKFQEGYYPLTEICRTSKDIAEVIKGEGIQKVFIGADTLFMLRKRRYSLRQLKWYNPTQNEVFPNPFWGDFLEYDVNVPIIGFSIASLDTDGRLFLSQKHEIKRYLKRFRYLSARDLSTAELIRYFTDGEVQPKITPDPVFNFNENVDLSGIEKQVLEKFNITKEYYLISMPQPFNKKLIQWAKDFGKIVRTNGYDLIELPRQTGKADLEVKQMPYHIITPLEWYILLKNAKGYVGGLMHTIVSCVHNKIPFYSFDYYGTSSMHNIYVDYTTSKVYQIIKQCGLLEYYTNIRARFKTELISAEVVFHLFEVYNIKQLVKASDMMRGKLEKDLKELDL